MHLPRQIGPLTLMRQVGTDPLSTSYAGILDEPAGEQVIVRQVAPGLLTDVTRMSVVQARLSELRKLRHHALEPVLDVVTHEGEWYTVSPSNRGTSLATLRDRARSGQRLPPNVFLHVATQMCNALEALHSTPSDCFGATSTLHLALTAEAVMLSEDCEVRLGGYAPWFTPIPLLETTSEASLGHLAPEQIDRSLPLGPPTDLFALGTLLYELLTGAPLFEAGGVEQTLHAIRAADVGARLTEVASILPGLEKILARTLERDPRHRYLRAFVLREDLRGLMASYSFADIDADARAALSFLPGLLAGGDGVRLETADIPYSGFSDQTDEKETELRRDLLSPPLPESGDFETTDTHASLDIDPPSLEVAPSSLDRPPPGLDIAPPSLELDVDTGTTANQPVRITEETTDGRDRPPPTAAQRLPSRPASTAKGQHPPEPARSPEPLDFDPNQELTDPGNGGGAAVGAAIAVGAMGLLCLLGGAAGTWMVLQPDQGESEVAAASPAVEEAPVEAPTEEPPLRSADAAAVEPAPRAVAPPTRPAAPPPAPPPPRPSPAPAPRAATSAPAPRVLPNPQPAPPEPVVEPVLEAVADAEPESSEAPFSLDDPESWQRLTELAQAGRLDPGHRAALSSVLSEAPDDYTRARTILYENARARRDEREQRAQLGALFALKQNTYNPVLLIEDADLSIRGKNYAHALEQATRAERYWARIPSDLIFVKKATIYEAQARAHQGLFYGDPDNTTHLQRALDAWERYRRHVESGQRSDLMGYADTEIAKLSDARARLE